MSNARFDRGEKMKGFGRARWQTVAMALILAILAGCAQDQPEINRVQPDGIEKNLLDGEWYYRSTVVEAASLSGSSFPGLQNSLERGVFEIEEDTLYFRRTYEFTTGAEVIGQTSDVDTALLDAAGQPVTTTKTINGEEIEVPLYVYRGAPIMNFPIASHFDIKASYNATTGEVTNVIEENTSDNKWYEREWIRVDWEAGDWTGMDMPLQPRSVVEMVSPVSGGAPEDAPVFEFEGEEGSETLTYFDVNSRYISGADMTWYGSSYGYIPTCWFYPWFIGQIFECSSEEYTVRHAFLRYDGSDYVPQQYDDVELQKFGYYRAERPTYDQDRGITYTGVSRQQIRQRIWEEYILDEDGELDYANMTPRPIVYYLTEKFPRDLVVSSIEIANEWSEPFTETVTFLNGDAPDYDMFILCENNAIEAAAAEAAGLPTAVWRDDDDNPNAKYCDVTDDPKRIGDIRYSLLASVNQPISYGLYGFGPPSYDPLTGEVLSSNAYCYTAAMKRGATRALDTIEMMAGVRTFLEIENSSYIKLHGYTKRLNGAGTVHKAAYTASEAQAIAAKTLTPEMRIQLMTVGLEVDDNFTQTRMNLLKSRPDIEQMMVGEDVRALLRDPSFFEGKDMDPEIVAEHLAPRNWLTLDHMRKKQLDDHNHAISTVYMEQFTDSAILALVREYKQRYDEAFCSEFAGQFDGVLDWDVFNEVGEVCDAPGAVSDSGNLCVTLTDEVKGNKPQNRWVNVCSTRKLIDQMRVAVETIEGLDPNATYDPPSPFYVDTKDEALNEAILAFRGRLDELRAIFHIELWQMIYKGVQLHEVGHNLGLRHNFEGSTDALNFSREYWENKMFQDSDGTWHPANLWQRDTEQQAYNRLRELQSASVMDYTSKFNGRNAGLGGYDKAVIKYGYGDIVEVFDRAPDLDALAPYMAEPTPGGASGNVSVLAPSGETLEDALKKVHHTSYLKYFDQDLDALFDRHNALADELSDSDVEVPYRFCSDELAGYTPTCQRWDEGVDPFEIATNYSDNYENYWPLQGYSHNSVTWSYLGYYNGVLRYFSEMRRQFETWVQLTLHYNTDDWWAKNVSGSADEPGMPWDQDINGGLTYTLAAHESFNIIANAFGRPSESRFGHNPNSGRYEPINYYVTTTYTNQVEITQLDGARPFYTAFDFEGYLYTPYRAGAIYDRLAAFAVLADPSMTPFIYTDTSADATRYLTSYYTIFPKQLVRLMGSLMTTDEQNYGWWTCRDLEGKVEAIERRDFFESLPPENCEQALYPESFSVFPNSRYRIPLMAAMYGMAVMTENYDYSFLDSSRLCLDGSGECMSFADGADVAVFEDPLSGKKYTAARVGDESVYDASYNLVNAANAEFDNYLDDETGELNMALLQDNYYLSELQFLIGRLELVRGMHQIFEL